MRKIFIIILCCVAGLLSGYAGYRGYKVWKNKHLISVGREFLAKSDRRNAALSAQEVLRSDPKNLDATRVMARAGRGRPLARPPWFGAAGRWNWPRIRWTTGLPWRKQL